MSIVISDLGTQRNLAAVHRMQGSASGCDAGTNRHSSDISHAGQAGPRCESSSESSTCSTELAKHQRHHITLNTEIVLLRLRLETEYRPLELKGLRFLLLKLRPPPC